VKVLVYEYISAGGFTLFGRALVPEGLGMLRAVLADFVRSGHRVYTVLDRRLEGVARLPRGCQVVPAESEKTYRVLVRASDAVLVIAPETQGVLARLTAEAERAGRLVLGSASRAVRIAGHKAKTGRVLRRLGIPTPPTWTVRTSRDLLQLAPRLHYPVVCKPPDGVGCEGVFVARTPDGLLRAARVLERSGQALLVQPYIEGVHASVALLGDGRRAVPLCLNAQWIRGSRRLVYCGGATPLEHPMAGRAMAHAARVVEGIGGLRGFFGVDLVLTRDEAFVIEVNPRITTAYLGVRRVFCGNLAEAILQASQGRLPARPEIRGRATYRVG
jgi:predicted ATP-grasp superfamily ATP-dependent carboligase